jgi:hypothetical protein
LLRPPICRRSGTNVIIIILITGIIISFEGPFLLPPPTPPFSSFYAFFYF